MKVATQRRIDQRIGKILCFLLSIFHKLSSLKLSAVNDCSPKNILVILLSEMGSLVLAYPMFEKIKEKFPEASISVLVFQRNKEVIELLNLTSQDKIYTINDRSLTHMAATSLQVLKRLRRQPVDTVIDCELFSRISSIYSYLSGAAIRTGFHPHTQEGLYRGSFISHPVLYNPYMHISEQFINLVEAISGNGQPMVKRTIKIARQRLPTVKIKNSEIQQFKKRVNNDFPDIDTDKLILLYPGGGLLPIRAWPIKHYGQLAKNLIDNGYNIGIIGLETDTPLAKQIINYCGKKKSADMTGFTKTVSELITLFHLSRLLITNDGGPGHFATLTRMPAVIFYGPETPVLYGPLRDDGYIFFSGISCSPCLTAYNHRNSPCDGNNVCLQSISPDVVLKKSFEILNA